MLVNLSTLRTVAEILLAICYDFEIDCQSFHFDEAGDLIPELIRPCINNLVRPTNTAAGGQDCRWDRKTYRVKYRLVLEAR
jgi:hypothetical protein